MLTLVHTGLLLDSDAGPVPQALAVRQQWTAVAAGCAAAALAAWLLAPVASVLQPSPFVIIVASCIFIAISAGAGVLAVWIAQLSLPAALPSTAAQISLQVVAGWIFFPSIALLAHKHSLLALLPAAIAAFAATLRVRSLFLEPELSHAFLRRQPARPLGSFYGLPPSDARPALASVTAICALGMLICAFDARLYSAVVLLAASLSLPLWCWSAFSPSAVRRLSDRRFLYLTTALALLFTILAVAPESFASGFWPFIGRGHRSLYAPHVSGAQRGVDRDYISIILSPPPAKKTRIVPPPPDSGPGSASAKSIVIPFDGSYWYFQPPAVGPGVRAHQAHGTPTAADIRSTNVYPLAMEAHQKLDLPIDLSCCRAIDLTITNADTRPGPITLTMRIEDSSMKGGVPLSLGNVTVRSSAIAHVPLNRQPVQETLHFLMPPSKTLRRFDRISVIYTPAGVRSHVGAKVSVDSFTLVPR